MSSVVNYHSDRLVPELQLKLVQKKTKKVSLPKKENTKNTIGVSSA